jgi:hypothetical protein
MAAAGAGAGNYNNDEDDDYHFMEGADLESNMHGYAWPTQLGELQKILNKYYVQEN